MTPPLAKNSTPAPKKPKAKPGPKRGRKSASVFKVPKLDLKLKAKLVKEGTLKSSAAKEAIAFQVVVLLQAQALLQLRMGDNSITGDEIRAMSGMASNIRRLLQDLGVLGDHNDGEEDDL